MPGTAPCSAALPATDAASCLLHVFPPQTAWDEKAISFEGGPARCVDPKTGQAVETSVSTSHAHSNAARPVAHQLTGQLRAVISRADAPGARLRNIEVDQAL